MKRLIIAMLAIVFFAGTAYCDDSALTVTDKSMDVMASFGTRIVYGYITLSAGDYPSTGWELDAGDFGMHEIESISFSHRSGDAYATVFSSGSRLLLTQTPANTTVVTAAPVTTDSDRFIVTDDNSAASNGKLMCIMPTPGTSTAQIGIVDSSFGATTSAHIKYGFFAAADSATLIGCVDTVYSQLGLLAHPVFGDTLYFDDDATNSYERLMYSGTSLGDQGTLYVQYSNGRMLQVLKKTTSEICQAAALALYFDENGGLDDKVLSITDSDEDSEFSADITYTSLAKYYRALIAVPVGTVLTETTYWFTAIGK